MILVVTVYEATEGYIVNYEFPENVKLRLHWLLFCAYAVCISSINLCIATILAKMCGTECLFPELLQFSLAPPFPPDAMLDDSLASLSLRTTLHGGRGGGGESRIWPKERWFPCEKLIDGRGSAFCKLVPHNFGQDCRSLL